MCFQEQCKKWALGDRVQMISAEHLPACPCTLKMAKNDGRFVDDIFTSSCEKSDKLCMRTTIPS